MDFQKDPDFVKKRFEYMRTKKDEYGSGRDFIFKEKVPSYTTRDGSNLVRIMEGTWQDAKHYGYEIWAHYNIGPNKSTFLCLEKMGLGHCPICDEQRASSKRGDKEYAATLVAQRRVLSYIIDRMAEELGPLVWNMPYARVAKPLLKLAYDKRGDGFLLIDDPQHGYDISFEKKGKMLQTQYEALKIEPRSVPLSESVDQMEKWISITVAKPIPSLLEFKSPDYIRQTLLGEQDSSKDVDEKPITTRAGAAALAEMSTSSPTITHATIPLPPSSEMPKVHMVPDSVLNISTVKAMNRRALEQLVEEKHLEIDPVDYDSTGDLASMILLELGLT